MSGGRHTRFDSMTFPPYQYHEYPRAIQIPRTLPKKMPDCSEMDDGSRNFDGNGHLLAVVKDGKWEAWPIEVIVNNETEERELQERLDTGRPLTAERERAELLQQCVLRGVRHDNRWGIDKLKKALAA